MLIGDREFTAIVLFLLHGLCYYTAVCENMSSLNVKHQPDRAVGWLTPKEIHFTQNSINARFSKFANHKALYSTLEDLLYNKIKIDDIEKSEVVYMNGSWWALTGNRRLYIYKELEELGELRQIQVVKRSLAAEGVEELFSKRFSTDNNGTSVKVLLHRMYPESDVHDIRIVIYKWKKMKVFPEDTILGLTPEESRIVPIIWSINAGQLGESASRSAISHEPSASAVIQLTSSAALSKATSCSAAGQRADMNQPATSSKTIKRTENADTCHPTARKETNQPIACSEMRQTTASTEMNQSHTSSDERAKPCVGETGQLKSAGNQDVALLVTECREMVKTAPDDLVQSSAIITASPDVEICRFMASHESRIESATVTSANRSQFNDAEVETSPPVDQNGGRGIGSADGETITTSSSKPAAGEVCDSESSGPPNKRRKYKKELI